MCDEAIRNTTKCLFGYKCIAKDPQYPICTVVDASDENVLFVTSGNGFGCPHHGHFGNARVCTCPKHYSLHFKPDSVRSSPAVLGRGGKSDSDRHPKGRRALPSTAEEAAKILIDELPLKDKVAIANASAEEVGELTISLIHVIRHAFGLESGNHALWQSCSKEAGCAIEHPEDVAAHILARLVMELVKTHKLNSVS